MCLAIFLLLIRFYLLVHFFFFHVVRFTYKFLASEKSSIKDKRTTLILKPKSNKRQCVIIVLVVNLADH